jgi:hypothetical protein
MVSAQAQAKADFLVKAFNKVRLQASYYAPRLDRSLARPFAALLNQLQATFGFQGLAFSVCHTFQLLLHYDLPGCRCC